MSLLRLNAWVGYFGRCLFFSFMLVMLVNDVFAQQKITGVVKNANGTQPLENVSIQVKGTQRGTTSSASGAFSIEAAENEILVFSSVGYQQTEVRVKKQGQININLPDASNELESVVVTALGISRKEKALGYAVSDIKGEQLTEAMSNNWTNALSGKVAGLNMLKSGGGPAGSNKIILRGENSLS